VAKPQVHSLTSPATYSPMTMLMRLTRALLILNADLLRSLAFTCDFRVQNRLLGFRGATTFSKFGGPTVQFFGLGYSTEQNTYGRPNTQFRALQSVA